MLKDDVLVTGTSCVIPAYNAEETIERALSSILATPGIAEIIVVDDGSRDGTSERVRKIAAASSVPIELIRQENRGASAARNTGMQAAGCDWIAFFDADDEMLPEAISSKAAHLAKCSNPEQVGSVYGSFVHSNTLQTARFTVTYDRVDTDVIGRPGGFPGGIVSHIFRRKQLAMIDGFRTELRMYEDFELLLRFIAGGARVVGCGVPGFHRHYIPGSLTRGASLEERLECERHFLHIARRDNLLSRGETVRRLVRNRARQAFLAVTGK